MNYQEHVFRPSRRLHGKSVRGRLYVGQYFFAGMDRPERVRLNTRDESVAEHDRGPRPDYDAAHRTAILRQTRCSAQLARYA